MEAQVKERAMVEAQKEEGAAVMDTHMGNIIVVDKCNILLRLWPLHVLK